MTGNHARTLHHLGSVSSICANSLFIMKELFALCMLATEVLVRSELCYLTSQFWVGQQEI